MQQRKITVRDVAIRAGVSTATVSRTINRSPHVTPETRMRVEKAIRDLGYVVGSMAQTFRNQHTRTIGLVLPGLINPFFAEIVTAVQTQADARGYSVLVMDNSGGVEQAEDRLLRVLFARMVDGIILVGDGWMTDAVREAFAEQDYLVALDRFPGVRASALVTTDSRCGIKALVGHLAGLGHRRIAHVGGTEGLSTAQERAAGFRDAMSEFGLPVPADLVIHGDFTADWGFEAVHTLLDRGAEFTAVVAGNDLIAMGAIAALTVRGLRVPDEVSVVGFDGIHLGAFCSPPLTTLSQPIDHIGQRATDILVDLVERDEYQAIVTEESVVLPGELVVRASSGPAPSGALKV